MLKSIALICAVFLLTTATAQAENKGLNQEQEAKIKQLYNLLENDPDGCDKAFKILWKGAKKGDLNARLNLLAFMTIMHGPDMALPGSYGDYITRNRHYIIMAANSVGADLEKTANGTYYTDLILSGSIAPNSPSLSKSESEFRKCLVKSRSNKCVANLEKDLIPPFDMFADEIDTFIKAGYKARCSRPQE